MPHASSVGPTGQTGDVGQEDEGPSGWRAGMGWFADRIEEEQRQRAAAQARQAELVEQQWEVVGSIGTAGFESIDTATKAAAETAQRAFDETGEVFSDAAQSAADAAEGAAWKVGLAVPIGLGLTALLLAGTAAVVVGGVVLYTNPQILAGAALAKGTKS